MAKALGNTAALIARKQRGLTQQGLGKRVGLTANDIVRIERYGWIPPAASRKRLAAELRSSVDALFGDGLRQAV